VQQGEKDGRRVGGRTYHLAGTSQAGVGTSSGCIHLWRFESESRTSCSAVASYERREGGRQGRKKGRRVAF
jgi:hypothetical protein